MSCLPVSCEPRGFSDYESLAIPLHTRVYNPATATATPYNYAPETTAKITYYVPAPDDHT